MVHATMIGRAFALLSTSAPAPAGKSDDDIAASAAQLLPIELRLLILDHLETLHAPRQHIWTDAIVPIFVKALLSGRDPAPAARFAAGIVVLTAWSALAATRPPLIGRGIDYIFWDGMVQDAEWDLERVRDALLATAQLPRDSWDVERLKVELKAGVEAPEYVPLEAVLVLDAARRHVHDASSRDHTSAETIAMVQDMLDQARQTASDKGKQTSNWDSYFERAYDKWETEAEGYWEWDGKVRKGRK
ncbi:hypothetical protein MKEN_01253900 [Mycena kentingensis (nom. inval.)]|nr:hypothetical protein MKEN_01253900 [Mycena kentingensis (nom. inval.)]